MKKSKYIKPQCEDIFLARGSGEVNCARGSVATGVEPAGCKTGDAATQSCVSGPLVVSGSPCVTGTAAGDECVAGTGAIITCRAGSFVGG